MKKTPFKIALAIFVFSMVAAIDKLTMIEAAKAKIAKIYQCEQCLTQTRQQHRHLWQAASLQASPDTADAKK